MSIFTIDLDKLAKLTKEGDKIFIGPEGEKVLIQILEAERQIELIKEEIKLKLSEAASKIDPNFSSIQADLVKVYYREYGSKYYVDEAQLELIPEGLVDQKITYQINTKAVEDWVDKKGGMPTGIKEVERTKTLSFSLKTNGKSDAE